VEAHHGRFLIDAAAQHFGKGGAMPAVKCSVDGCSRKLQPVEKLDPRDRESWVYRECDVCFRPVCEQHSTEVEGRIVCDRCRREKGMGLELIPLEIKLRS